MATEKQVEDADGNDDSVATRILQLASGLT